MSRTLYEGHGVIISRFYGGSDRGTCIQIETPGGPAQLTRAEFAKLMVQVIVEEVSD
jgi:hypothetical protein